MTAPAPLAEMLVLHREPFATEFGDFTLVTFQNGVDDRPHLALVKGDVCSREDVPVRLHSECVTGDVLGSLRCDCRDQLHESLRQLARRNRGVLLYLRQEGRGIGLVNKLRAYALQDKGLDTVEANHALGFADDLRDYRAAALMLRALGVRSIRLLTNNPNKLRGLEANGVRVADRVPLALPPNPHNHRYLETKRVRSGHLLKPAAAPPPGGAGSEVQA
ncbi:MAG TPA: GTP cyclohydrolase II [Candidatus Thermoplasmatota archaeon]|nr:GTP cyclohydrolase II [Candidatus Thermoplasmatota archaeon]